MQSVLPPDLPWRYVFRWQCTVACFGSSGEPDNASRLERQSRRASQSGIVAVAETQSFANASRQIGVAKSVVTTLVKQPEEHLGVALFHRSTRAVKLSESGEIYYRDCSDLMSSACNTRPKNSSAQSASIQRTTSTMRRSGSIHVNELPAPKAK